MNLDLILPLEQAWKAYLVALDLLAGPEGSPAFSILCAHEAEVISTPDYLIIISGRPGGELLRDGCAEIKLEFQLHTSEITNEARRPDAVALHDTRASNLEQLLAEENFDASLAAIAGFSSVIGFTGWEVDPDADPAEKDGRTEEQTLLSRLRYVFDCFRV